jgi:hypothetical protein
MQLRYKSWSVICSNNLEKQTKEEVWHNHEYYSTSTETPPDIIIIIYIYHHG